jgi:hypothetical protein
MKENKARKYNSLATAQNFPLVHVGQIWLVDKKIVGGFDVEDNKISTPKGT